MVELKTENINNKKRKFISTNNNYLDDYLSDLILIEEYNIIQTFKDNVKYNKIFNQKEEKYTKNINLTETEKIIKDEYNKIICLNNYKVIEKYRKSYIDKNLVINVDYFIKPNKFTVIEISNNKKEFIIPKGLIEVTDNKHFLNINIFNNSIKSNIILEGTDGVGKTTTIKSLLEYGIICQDRSTDIVSKNMLFDINMNYRAIAISNYLKENDTIIIFLINNNKEELESRINNRTITSDFDLDAYKYNQLYLETYNYMKEKNILYNKLFLADCTDLNLNEQISKVKKIIKEHHA